jgi:hypothetical protein
MRLGAKEKGLVPKNCFQNKRGLREGVLWGFELFGPAPKDGKEGHVNLMSRIQQRSKSYFGSEKGESTAMDCITERQFSIIHNFLLRTQN